MLRFRSSLPASPVPLSDDSVRRLAEGVLAPGHFFTGPGVRLEWEHKAAQETAWEVFHGRLVDRAFDRAELIRARAVAPATFSALQRLCGP